MGAQVQTAKLVFYILLIRRVFLIFNQADNAFLWHCQPFSRVDVVMAVKGLWLRLR